MFGSQLQDVLEELIRRECKSKGNSEFAVFSFAIRLAFSSYQLLQDIL